MDHFHDTARRRAEQAEAGRREIDRLRAAVQGECGERQRAEETVRRERARFAAIIDSVMDALITIDADQRIVMFNRAAERMFGCSAVQAIGTAIDRFVPQRLRAAHRENVAKFRQSGDSRRPMGGFGEVVGLRANGEEFPVDASISRFDCNGERLLSVVLRDVTERRKVEEALKRNRDQLEELVAERTAELSIAKQRAEVANRAKSAFLASMSHELRTPLNAVLGYAQILMREESLTERQAVGLSTIEQSGEHLLMLLTDILDLSRIEAERLELYPGTVSLRPFLRVIADIIGIKAEKKGLQFACSVAPEIPRAVRADEKRLRQVLLNLLDNAVRFTDRGTVSLGVRLAPGRDSAQWLRFEVSDTGIGMNAGQMEAIFKPFEQVSDVAHRSGGSGLGLAISRQLVRLMGSEIQVESRAQEGSVFWFELHAPVETEDAEPVLPRRIDGYSGPRRKVLIVDDEASNRMMLADFLGSLGFEIRRASDARQALEQANANAPDLVVMDVRLPDMDGLEATRRMRLMPACGDIPIIAVSASGTDDDRYASIAAGADAFLAKPIRLEQLLEVIGTRLQLEWQYAAPPAVDAARAAAVIAPPFDELDVLHTLALAGNMHDLRERAAHIASLGAQYRPFAEKLAHLAEKFQSKAILRFVEEHRLGRSDT